MKQKILAFLLFLPGLGYHAAAQTGCTDARATNFAPSATSNDGSCVYPTTTAPLPSRATLPSEVHETSGLIYTNQQLWTINDSGNEPVLYRLDAATGAVQQRVRISNFANVDWEDLTADDRYLYIGDFGNNAGNRRDLRVLRVPKAAIGTAPDITVAAEPIAFSYPQQTNFQPPVNQHNFDAEAFFVANDSLHIFTKNWADQQTSYYTVPATPGTYAARYRAMLNVNGLVTGAALNAAGTEATLLGYTATGATFAWLLFDFPTGRVLQGNKRRIDLPSALLVGQVEALTFTDRYSVLVSNERLATSFLTVPPRLYSLALGEWLAPVATTSNQSAGTASFALYPNPARHVLRVQTLAPTPEDSQLTVHDSSGRLVLAAQLHARNQSHELNLAHLAPGLYAVRITSAHATYSQTLLIE
ncbi:T9SS type A sorting domain-containing protein [Hymenobacter defluvii]|uniref:T9SS type A sorting domain-containing protein n=1 Tax=Hymenobacter defluvii TaxID=2054411 RepID=A0ABS3TBV7_9BACT|nr:T9SS type A sorting domain-containing protein [Hymenobacter defluvii]MBO3271128.1 T9SS type A sorting domain-containing protein [Hymenobacter defluvii]